MNSTGRWVHGMTKINTDCNHRNTAGDERHVTELCLPLKWNRSVIEKSAYLEQNPSVWFPDKFSWAGKKNFKKSNERFLLEQNPGFNVLHNNQIPHACAEETSWRRFWNSSCIGIFSHPNGSVGEPWDWTCLRKPCCSVGRKTASLLWWGEREEKREKLFSDGTQIQAANVTQLRNIYFESEASWQQKKTHINEHSTEFILWLVSMHERDK